MERQGLRDVVLVGHSYSGIPVGQAAERIGEQIARLVGGSTPHPGATLTEPAVLSGQLGELPATYVLCVMPGTEPEDAEPDEVVAELVDSKRWRLVTMDTGHWPMFSRPHELAQILLDAAVE